MQFLAFNFYCKHKYQVVTGSLGCKIITTSKEHISGHF